MKTRDPWERVGLQVIVEEVMSKARFREAGMKWLVEVKGEGTEGCFLK